ncbi:type IV secretion system protein [Gymnodinialimonas sp. 2305UL16-5]|uniref:type IV secretion system protein n=1 Tax=Gymnodinialimonas mytili TaxID=3126503 RepID=UPI0030B7834B
MGFVEVVVTGILELIEGLDQSQFGNLSSAFARTGQLAASLIVVITIINMAIQRVSVPLETSIGLIVRITFVALFFQSWTQFSAVAYAIQEAFNSVAAILFSGTEYAGETSVARALDNMIGRVAEAGTNAVGRLDVLGAVMNGVFFLLISVCGALAAAGLIVASVAFTLILSLAPLAILATLWQGTRSYFQSWLNAAIAFLLFPAILAGTLGIIVQLGNRILLERATEVETLGATFPFGMFLLLSIIMLLLTPFLVTMLTGQFQMGSLATMVGGAALLSRGLGFAGRSMANNIAQPRDSAGNAASGNGAVQAAQAAQRQAAQHRQQQIQNAMNKR